MEQRPHADCREEDEFYMCMLISLKKRSLLPDSPYKHLCSSEGNTRLFYGLPKVHRKGIHLRPIVSFVSSFMYSVYNLYKFLANALSPPVGRTASHVPSGMDFTKTAAIPYGFALVSYDVISIPTIWQLKWPREDWTRIIVFWMK